MNPKLFNKVTEIAFALQDKNYPINQHYTFIIYKNRILTIGKNSPKTHPINLRNPKFSNIGEDISGTKFRCSELNSILKIKKQTRISFNKLIMINIRIDRNGLLANSKPCSSCISLASHIKPKAIYYTNDLGVFSRYF